MTVISKGVSRLALVVMATVALSACSSTMASQPSMCMKDGMCPTSKGKMSCCADMSKAEMKNCADMPCCQGKSA